MHCVLTEYYGIKPLSQETKKRNVMLKQVHHDIPFLETAQRNLSYSIGNVKYVSG